MSIELINARVASINISVPDVTADKRNFDVRIETQFSTDEKGERCVAVMNCKVEEKEKESGNGIIAEIKVEGLFSSSEKIQTDDEKPQKMMMRLLFPYVRASLATITSLSGIPSITLPTFEF